MNKYRINQVVLTVAFVAAGLNVFWIVFGGEAMVVERVLQFLVSCISLHYLCNIVHLASHSLLSRNRHFNHILGTIGASPVLIFSFVDFKVTHLDHHKHATSPDFDPDYKITNNGTIATLPFRILWYKDGYFWKYCLEKSKFSYIAQYLAQRIFQLGFFGYAVTRSVVYSDNSLAHFYIVPLIIVGLGYAGYVYYYPHYQNAIEKYLRSTRFGIIKLIGKPFLWSIDLSRVIHHKHHDAISDNSCYYPEIWLWYNRFYNLPETLDSSFISKKTKA
jgi:fatty acid desaturase